MKIRIMMIKDFDEIYTLWKEVGLKIADHKTEEEEVKKMITLNPMTNFVVCDGMKIIGTVFGIFNGRRAWIHHLAVHPAFQNMGIGSLLLKKVEQALKIVGAERVCLWVDKINLKVLFFYKKYGYREMKNAICLRKNL
ncbi:GNAT family N-acetyltransferase [Candidatus Daviesbacteria bacterium]|nr:GNAT family N-acetyltransferase [Candidatus Daviesbacteria bacterium]